MKQSYGTKLNYKCLIIVASIHLVALFKSRSDKHGHNLTEKNLISPAGLFKTVPARKKQLIDLSREKQTSIHLVAYRYLPYSHILPAAIVPNKKMCTSDVSKSTPMLSQLQLRD